MLLAAATLSLTLPCPETATCLEADRLVAVSSDPARAALILETAIAAQGQFEDRFGLEAGPVAVVEDISLYPNIALDMRAAGYRVKPWISPMGMRQALESQIRPAMEQAMAGVPQATIDARIEAMLSERVDNTEKVRYQDAIISHELGHMWLIDGISWPEVETGGQRFYGAAAAPDWIDEVFAVALETPALTEARRTNFCAGRPDDQVGELDAYLTMDHPLLAAAAAAAEAQARAQAQTQAQTRTQPGAQSGPPNPCDEF